MITMYQGVQNTRNVEFMRIFSCPLFAAKSREQEPHVQQSFLSDMKPTNKVQTSGFMCSFRI